ncbi:MAG TPA: NAD-dependent epimerase/dehydratase family protein [Candidatus Kapabacteria bacterium]|nr:NAD-dependent epimerase/dehydratase family protein [Candidatus Kapabacteria bacterium]
MQILITGATGFVGSHVADRLIDMGHTVRALTRSTSSTKWLADKPIQTVQGNMLDIESLREAVEGTDAVIHIAGVTAAKDKKGFYEGNQLSTRNLLEAVKRYNPGIKHFIHASSQTAVGPSLDGTPVTETTPPHPITTYGMSKRAAEEECERMREHFPITILRLAAVYGPRDTAILTIFQTFKQGLKPLIGFRDKYVNLVHIDDVVQSFELSLAREEAKNQTYLIGAEQHYTWKQVSNIACEIMQRRAITVRLPHALVYTVAGFSELFNMIKKKPSVLNWEKGKDIVQANWTCSVEKAMREMGYKQNVALDEGIRKTTEWFKQHSWL